MMIFRRATATRGGAGWAHAFATLALVASVLGTSCDVYAVDAKDTTALRRKCAHDLKVKLGIKETGSVKDLEGVHGASQMVDQCVANGGKS